MKKRNLITTALLLGFITITSTTSTFAWIAAQRNATADLGDFNVDVADGNLKITKVESANTNGVLYANVSGNGKTFYRPWLASESTATTEKFSHISNVTDKPKYYYNSYTFELYTEDIFKNTNSSTTYLYLSPESVVKFTDESGSKKLFPALRMSITIGGVTKVLKFSDQVIDDNQFITNTTTIVSGELNGLGTYEEGEFIQSPLTKYTKVTVADSTKATINDFTKDYPILGSFEAGKHETETGVFQSDKIEVNVKMWIEGTDPACIVENVEKTLPVVEATLKFNTVEITTEDDYDFPVPPAPLAA